MRGSKLVLAALATGTLALAAVVGPGSGRASGEARPGPCAIERRDGQSVASWMKAFIRCAVDKWAVPGGAAKAICIARAESGLNPKATSSDGKYLGLFQHDADVWPDRYKAWTKGSWRLDPSALSGRTNTIVTIRMVNADGWGPWSSVQGC
jgi:hypothetical protein